MRDLLEKLLRTVDVPNPEHAQLRWDEYRAGADSSDPAAKAAADAAFATLVAWYGAALYRHIWGFVRSDAAEDVLQDVLRKLHESRRSPRLADFHASVLPWLRRVAIRQCLDAHRRRKRRRERESRAARPEGGPPPGDRAELQEALAAALGRLPEEQRQAVALHFFEGLDRQAAAAALGINRDTFSARLDAALERLRKLVPVPAAVALGGVLDMQAALAVAPPALSAAKFGELAVNAWAAASAWTARRVAAVVLLGLTVCGAAAAAGWALTRDEPAQVVQRPDPPVVPLPAPKNDPPRPPAETLQAKNERLARAKLVDPLRELLQKFYPDNPVHLHSLRAVGSEVEVEFRPERPPAFAEQAARLRGRYCTFRRQLVIHGQPAGETRWYWMDPERPFVIPAPALLGGEVVRGREEFAEARRLFDRVLPRDDRAEADQILSLFGPPGGEFLLPTGMTGFSSFPGGLMLSGADGGLFIRDSLGRWRYAGERPGWFPVVAGDRVYCIHNGISSRRLDEHAAAWVKYCDLPPTGPGEERGVLFAAGGQLRMGIDPGFLASHPLDNPAAGWARVAVPVRAGGLAEAGGMLFGNDGKRLLARPVADAAAPWAPVGPWPDPDCGILVADGDRLLALSHWKTGPIYDRRVKAAPDETWAVVGRVHDPWKEK